VNPQGTTMAIALRNVDHFAADRALRPTHARSVGRALEIPPLIVTGAPGWLGTRLVEVLVRGLPGVPQLQEPDPRRVIRCLVHPDADTRALAALSAGIEVEPLDLADPASIHAALQGAAGATLFHIAGVIHPTRGTREFTRVNVEGTRHLLQASERAGVRRFVAVSSNSPFGFNPSPEHLFDERSAYRPYMGYGRSKALMEALVGEAQARGLLETVIVRPPWFYGPHQPPRQTLFFRMIREGRFPILGDGLQRRSMVYVDNLCQGLWLAASVERAVGQAYWIADERPYTILEIVDTVRAVLEEEFGVASRAPRLRLPALLGELARLADGSMQALGLYHQKVHVLSEMGHSIACSIEKAKAELGYRPTVALRDGMIASIRWCLANGLRF
jgi:nucleoside-diphosphate-sugar epimerase